MTDPEKALKLARLAADERTPEHERTAAAMALAKLIDRDGLPGGGTESSSSNANLHRENEALRVIVEQNANELRTLRADKSDLEKLLVTLRTDVRTWENRLDAALAEKTELEKKLRTAKSTADRLRADLKTRSEQLHREVASKKWVRVKVCGHCGSENHFTRGRCEGECYRRGWELKTLQGELHDLKVKYADLASALHRLPAEKRTDIGEDIAMRRRSEAREQLRQSKLTEVRHGQDDHVEG
ncbi:MAG: hypothetical protein HOW73_43295 [Polyangiaceae bacterium]|nr:hypothetical protein [Polyangiaceae bacterium]